MEGLSDDDEWFDVWCEDHSGFTEAADYPALVECCRQRLQRNPGDPYAVESLAEAYVLNGQGSEAIRLVTPHYNNDPDVLFWQGPIIDALLSMGKDIGEFPWKSPPSVLRLAVDVLEECYQLLRTKRRPRTISELYITFLIGSYLLFSEEDLLLELRKDRRFVIEKPEEGQWAEVTVFREPKKKGKKRQQNAGE